MYVSNFVDL